MKHLMKFNESKNRIKNENTKLIDELISQYLTYFIDSGFKHWHSYDDYYHYDEVTFGKWDRFMISETIYDLYPFIEIMKEYFDFVVTISYEGYGSNIIDINNFKDVEISTISIRYKRKDK